MTIDKVIMELSQLYYRQIYFFSQTLISQNPYWDYVIK